MGRRFYFNFTNLLSITGKNIPKITDISMNNMFGNMRAYSSFKLSLFIVCILSLKAFESRAQANEGSPWYVSCELSSKYVWRGLEYGKSPTLFPSVNYENSAFLATLSGAYAMDGSHQEVDLGLNYTIKSMVTLGLNDYYFPSAVGQNDSYFHFRHSDTGHYVEACATVEPTKLPLWLKLSCYVYGADKDSTGKQAYSTYAELGYQYVFKNEDKLSLALGANLNKGFYTDYERGFNVVNIMLKYESWFTFNKFRLPVSASYVLNPYRNKSYFTFSVYFSTK